MDTSIFRILETRIELLNGIFFLKSSINKNTSERKLVEIIKVALFSHLLGNKYEDDIVNSKIVFISIFRYQTSAILYTIFFGFKYFLMLLA